MAGRKMKDSGVEWIGEIPENWTITKNKYIFKIHKQLIGKTWLDAPLLSLTTQGITVRDKDNLEGKLPESFETYQEVNEGDLILCLFDLDMSAVFSGLSPHSGMISPAYKRLKTQKGSSRYYSYLFDYIFQGRKYTIYSKTLRYTIDNASFGSIETVEPPYNEQTRIANYLDEKTAKIDDIISDIKKETETLEEYKKSVISEAVTKGLDKNVEMKDSGVAWIGKIPKHWKTRKIKYLSISRFEKRLFSEIKRYIGLENIESNTGRYTETESEYSDGMYAYCEKGDLLFGKLRPNLNKVLIAPFSACCTGEFEIIKSSEIGIKYLYYYFLTKELTDQIVASTYGAKMPRASWDYIKNIKLAFPGRTERLVITAYLDSFVNKINTVVDIKDRQIKTLEQYKKSLIYEYVTGKKEVKQ